MIKKKKKLIAEEMPEFQASVDSMTEESKIFVDKSIEIVDYIFQLMEEKGMKQKNLAEKMGKTEAELSKILSGMHNLTLRSIAKLEAALEKTIVCTPISYGHHNNIELLYGPVNDVSSKKIVNEKKLYPLKEKKLKEMGYGCRVIDIEHGNNLEFKTGAA
jgi:transcriptional regulator with XRE-family HTH domain